MFWQSLATAACILIAALILAARLRSFVRARSKGSCGTCSSCSGKKTDVTQTSLVQLGVKPEERMK